MPENVSGKISYANLVLTDEDHEQIDERIVDARSAVSDVCQMTAAAAEGDPKNWLADRNPADPSEIVFAHPKHSLNEVVEMFRAARVAQILWEHSGWRNRARVMLAFADQLEANQYALITATVLEAGKSRGEAKAEVWEAIELVRFYARQCQETNGYEVNLKTEPRAKYNRVVRRAIGVFAVGSPFNFPVALATGMCTGALLAGNAVVLKPSSDTPLTALLICEAFQEAAHDKVTQREFESLFNVAICPGKVFEDAIMSDPTLVDGLAFTGSKEVGMSLAQKLYAARPRKIVAELGGKNPCIVTPDCSDLAMAGKAIAISAFGYGGQKCSACSVVVAHKSILEKVVEEISKAAKNNFVLGDPSVRGVTLGPLINKAALATYTEAIKELTFAGATLEFPGLKTTNLNPNGYYAQPVIAYGMPWTHKYFLEELFVPVLCVMPYEGDIVEAVELANRPEYGLTAGLMSDNPSEIDIFMNFMEAGVLYVNRPGGATTGAWPGHQSFVGWKNSGIVGQVGVCGTNYVQQYTREQCITMC